MLLLGFALAVIVCIVGLVLGRWAAGLFGGGPVKRRRLRDAVAWNDGPGVAFGRVVGGAVGYYAGASLVLILAALAVGKIHVDETSMRVNVAPNGPAGRAGIKKGDRILSVDGVAIRDWDGLRAEIAKREGVSTPVEVERDGASMTIEVIPEATEKSGPAKILVGPFVEPRSVSLGEAIADGISEPAKILVTRAKAWGRLLGGQEYPEATGAVGIVREVQRAGAFVSGLRFGVAMAAYAQPWILFGMVAGALASRPWRKRSTAKL